MDDALPARSQETELGHLDMKEVHQGSWVEARQRSASIQPGDRPADDVPRSSKKIIQQGQIVTHLDSVADGTGHPRPERMGRSDQEKE